MKNVWLLVLALKVTKKDKKVTLSGDGKSKDITFSTKNDTKDKF